MLQPDGRALAQGTWRAAGGPFAAVQVAVPGRRGRTWTAACRAEEDR